MLSFMMQLLPFEGSVHGAAFFAPVLDRAAGGECCDPATWRVIGF
jgi:hypothetical protein